ncbi:MAG TPA: tetratricopeptide repeat protein, partial [Polyangiales bacterium]|nr:tetratricopeptide repeat protein [Polyangiales bacterium]
MSRTGRASSARRGVMAGLCLQLMLLGTHVVAQAPQPSAAGAPAPPAPTEPPVPERPQSADGQVTLPAAPREVPFDKSKPPGFLDTAAAPDIQAAPPPTHLQQAALKELEREVKRFTKIGGSYRDTIDALLRREYLRKRYAQDQNYARQIKAEEELEDKARLAAIALFERFIAKYPSDPEYTPDAMFRLGELYFERDSILQQQAQEQYLIDRDKAAETAQEGAEEPPVAEPTKDFNATIELYRRLVRNFPNYAKVDGVYYLIGYCLNEMGNTNEARLAWLNLVCANHYQYTGQEIPNDLAELPEKDDPALAHPALNL